MNKNLLPRLLAMLLVYVILRFFGGSFGNLVLYPVTMLVAFLHELGHATGAILTGGSVDGLQINPDGSGYTVTRGGSAGIILMGGYLGSALLGNLLFRIGVKHRTQAQNALLVLAFLMALSGIIWFESFISTALLFGFAAVLFFIARRTTWDQDMLMFLGLATVLYIIQDFRTGPSSDLVMYEKVVGIFPYQVWMYLWLALAIGLSFWNMRELLGRRGLSVG